VLRRVGTVTKGIWGEEPDPNDFFITVENWDWDKRFDVSAYLNKRDAWLEKVREELREAWVGVRAEARVHRQHRMLYQEQRNELREKLETAKNHINEYPDVNEGACKNCPYGDLAPEGICPTCAVGKVKIWLTQHKKILEVE